MNGMSACSESVCLSGPLLMSLCTAAAPSTIWGLSPRQVTANGELGRGPHGLTEPWLPVRDSSESHGPGSQAKGMGDAESSLTGQGVRV